MMKSRIAIAAAVALLAGVAVALADTTTTNFGWIKPVVNASSNTWGTSIDTNYDSLDATLGLVLTPTGNKLTPTQLVSTGNAISSAAWTTGGLRAKWAAATLTDTTSNGTVAAMYADAHKAATIATTSTTTYTDAYGAYFENPVAGTNATFTNTWALGADSAKINGAVTVTGNVTVAGSYLKLAGTTANHGVWLFDGGGGGTGTGDSYINRSNTSGSVNFNIPNSAQAAFLEGGTTMMAVGNNGKVIFPGVSTTASAANAFLDNAVSNNLLRVTSSIRYKTNIRYFAGPVAHAVLDGLKPILYTSLAAADDPKAQHYGLLAEDVAKIAPELVNWTPLKNIDAKSRVPDGYASMAGYIAANAVRGQVPDNVQYDRVVPLLIAEVKSLRARVSALEAAH